MLCYPHIFYPTFMIYQVLPHPPFTMFHHQRPCFTALQPFTMFYHPCDLPHFNHLRCFTFHAIYHASAVYHVLPNFRSALYEIFTKLLRNFYEVFAEADPDRPGPSIGATSTKTPQLLAEIRQKSEGSEGNFRPNVTYS